MGTDTVELRSSWRQPRFEHLGVDLYVWLTKRGRHRGRKRKESFDLFRRQLVRELLEVVTGLVGVGLRGPTERRHRLTPQRRCRCRPSLEEAAAEKPQKLVELRL